MPSLAIRVTTPQGDDMYVREGRVAGQGPVVKFRSRADASRTLQIVMPGLEEGDIATIIPFSRVPVEERD